MPAPLIWRTALRPRWLSLLGVVLVLCVAFAWLGHWQLDVARSKEHPKRVAVSATPVPLDQVTRPQQVFRTGMVGRAVTVTGEYDPSRQVMVSGKRLGGRPGSWVVTALRAPSGALVPVVRGFVDASLVAAATDSRVAPPSGAVTVRGVVQAPEAGAGAASPPPQGTVLAADTADLVNLWGGPIYNVLVFASDASTANADPAGMTPVPPVPLSSGGSLGLRNAAYAVQWWLFGAFALLLWWRMVRQETLDEVSRLAPAQQPIEPKELTTP